jgi:ankyrin repeat protein/nucleoside-triphosphatase THEP1
MTLLNDHDAAKDTEPPQKPVPGTCQWIYNHHMFASWLGQNSSALLWLTGHPGSGKTTMSYSLAEHFKDTATKSHNVLVYLCQNKNRQTDGRAVLIGLILQIVDRHRSLIRHIRPVFERQGSSMIQSFALLWRIFVNLLKDAKMGSPYIIIDALDECEEASCRQLLGSISDMLAESGSITQGGNTVKFLITSRPFLHDAYASTREPYRSRISIDDGHAGYVDDLRVFIQRRVDEITLNRQFPTEIRDFLLQTATSKADSTFLWIHMVLASIEKSLLTSKKDFQKIIASIPKDLKEVYQRYFSAIPSHYQDDASNLIKLLLSCSRPLHLDELNIAFTVNDMHITKEDILSETQGSITHTVQGILGTLVRVTGRHVSLIHQSLKEYLLEQGDAKYDSFPAMRMVNAQSSALQLATACIRYLLLQDFETDFFLTADTSCEAEDDIADLSHDSSPTGFGPNFWDDDGPDLATNLVFGETGALYPDICDSMTSEYAFYNYASLHWAEHYALCEEVASDDLRAAAESLLDTDIASCRNWLHFYYTQADHSIDDDNLAQQSPILLASQFNLNTVLNDLLLGESPSLDTKNRSLYWASRLGHDRIVASLLKIEADPNARASDGQTALTAASEYGNLRCVVELLKDNRTDAGLTGRKGRNALSFACSNGQDEIVNLLLRRNPSFANDTDNSGATPLFWAVGAGHQSTISTLARVRIVDLNHQDKAGRTAISWAAGDGMVDTLARLLRFPKIDVNLKDKKGKSPLCWAAGNGCDGAVRLLLTNKKVDKSAVDKDERNAISWAAAGGHHDTLVRLLDGGCPGVDDEDIDNWTPLAWAIQMDAADTIRALVNNDQVDIERRDGAGRTALSWAVEYGHAKVVGALLEAGADPEARSKRGSTPISVAKRFGRDDLLSQLMEYVR